MEIKFRVDTKHRKQWFTGISFSHPAKMSLPLQLWIIENYTKAGETILDPMAGSGTLMVCCSLGRHCILVELEEKFCKMMEGNWEKVKQRGAQMGYEMGTCQIIQGDARQLEGLLVDKCIFSPPYAETEAIKRLPNTPTSSGGQTNYEHQSNPNNISNLPYGEIDKCIFSPPFKEQMLDTDWMNKNFPRKHRGKHNPKEQDLDNIGNLPYGQIDTVVTSPPYEHQVHESIGGIQAREDSGEAAKLGFKKPGQLMPEGYTKSKENIGNLKSDSYLEAMGIVYRNCFSVLRDGGLMILVVKPFVRQGKVVHLEEDTKLLCEKAGFAFVEQHHRVLPSMSFWRVIYYRKYPMVERVDKEFILVFRKG